MTSKVAAAPIRLGVLGAARVADIAIVRPARATGHRLAAVAARDSVTTANGTRTEALGRRPSPAASPSGASR